MEETLVLVKGDGVRRRLIGEIIRRVENKGLDIGALQLMDVSRELAEEHYAEHREKPFFEELVEFITSSPTLALAVEGEGAIATVRATMGATDPANAAPGTLDTSRGQVLAVLRPEAQASQRSGCSVPVVPISAG